MSMVINTNIQATRTHNVYNKNNDYMNQALTRVATGQKINSAKDGAANWAISEKMRERIRANDQANQNVQNDTALLKTAQGGIDNTIDILKTLKERALNSANDSNINTDRSAIATEVYQLLEQMDDNAAKVKFNGRTLLNGDYDNGAADMFPVKETSATLADAEAAEFNGDIGSNAVLQLKMSTLKYDNSGASTAVGTNDATLVSLQDASGKSLGIKAGDKIQFSWEEDGVTNTKTFEVTNGMKLSDLAFTKGSLKTTYTTSATGLTDADSANVYKEDGTTAVNSLAGGFNAVGTGDAKITNFKVSVTYDDNGTTTTRTAAQDALKFEGVQQAKDPVTGSNAVYGIESGTAITTAVSDSTALKSVKFDSNYAFGVNDDADKLSIKIGTGDDAIEITGLTGASTVKDLKDALSAKGVTLQIATKGAELTDADENNVTQNTLDGAENLTSEKGGVYFIGKSGETLGQISIKATNSDADTGRSINGATASKEYVNVEKIQKADGSSSSGSSSNAITFHVGGEADFYLDMNIKTMTTQSLLGADSKTFATMFTDKATARDAVGIIDTAIQTALNEQTKLGAMESRLGYTSDNITTMNENLEAADSVYRDSDIAKEMTNYMKYTVLAQASQYMLAQTSQNAFSVLNLLQA
ncbi:MAG: hypothetical protein IKI08_06720 [Selenomonadaceae bacterium]|nr:hypothetical protein [Selenomonadaceae bacterium]MBR7025682.1 hypothetical protein [Selenomonadaceae bacterium]